MSLTDLMSGAKLATYPEIALALFMAAFVAVAIRLLMARDKTEWKHASALPLADEEETK